ncbi:hypothetical protein [Rhizobium leguminosarum]|uniref:hypothetical protein n=1 Tax=Rhizobium leguminosarum TaxID=384 RepID=UPI003F988E81
MNHFTPFLPAEALIRRAPISDERAGDLEARLEQATRTRLLLQGLLLLVTGFVFVFSLGAQVTP